MGDGHDGARVALQEALEPRHRLGVEVVGRLVEQQQIRLLEQHPAERDAALLAARQLGHVRVARRQAQRVHGDVEVPVEIPAVGRLDLLLDLAVLLHHLLALGPLGRAERRAELLEAPEQRPRARHRLLDVAAHVGGRVELGLLRQVADAHPLGGRRVAEELFVEPRHDAQERRLARPVRPDDADLGARVERQPDALQDLAVRRDHLAEVAHRENEFGGHGARASPAARSNARRAAAHQR